MFFIQLKCLTKNFFTWYNYNGDKMNKGKKILLLILLLLIVGCGKKNNKDEEKENVEKVNYEKAKLNVNTSLDDEIKDAASAIETILREGIDAAMNKFN